MKRGKTHCRSFNSKTTEDQEDQPTVEVYSQKYLLRCSGLSTILVCDMCYYARKINSYLTSQGTSVQVRENLTLSKKSKGGDISLKLNMFHWRNIVSRN